MSRSIYVLYGAYSVELAWLLGGCVYVWYCIIFRNRYVNEYLKGRRVWVAFFSPFIWIFFTGTDCYHTTMFMLSHNWTYDELALWDKSIRQCASALGTIITTLLIIGYQFGEKNGKSVS